MMANFLIPSCNDDLVTGGTLEKGVVACGHPTELQ